MLACTGRECDAPVERPPLSPPSSHPHREHSISETPKQDKEQIAEIDKHVRNLQKDLGLYARKLEAVESDLQKLEKADDVKVLSQQLEAVRDLHRKQMQETVYRFEERLQTLERASASAAEKFPKSATSGQPLELAPMSSVLALQDRLSKLEQAEEHLAAAVEAHDQELGGLCIEEARPHVDAAAHLQNVHMLNLQHEERHEEHKQRYDVILEELAGFRKWRANLEQQMDLVVKNQNLLEEEPHHTKQPTTERNVDDLIQSPRREIEENAVADFDHVYEFEGSVYDTLLFVNLPCVTRFQSFTIILGFICNVVMIVVTVQILATEVFTGTPFQDLPEMRAWRISDAHSYSYVDSVSHLSLATRVCDLDESLSVATYQKTTLQDIDDYEKYGGSLLANVGVVLWVFTCALEVRKTMDFFIVIWSMSRGKHTSVSAADDGGIEFETMSFPRVLLGSLAAVVRFTAACFLLAQGSAWLAYEPSITNLLLNASALGFILDLDSVIFSATSSYAVIGLLAALKPAALPKMKRMALVPVGIILGTTGFMIYINRELLDLLSQRMTLVRDAMCYPSSSLQMVIGKSPVGWLTYMDLPEIEDAAHVDEVSNHIILQSSEATKFALEVHDYGEVVQISSMDIGTFVSESESFICSDGHTTPDEGDLGKRLWAATGEAVRDVHDCADVRQNCTSPGMLGKNVRLLCPLTCGCSIGRPARLNEAVVQTQGLPEVDLLWDLALPKNGCVSEGCRSWKTSFLLELPCQDRNLSFLMNNGWKWLLDRQRVTGKLYDDELEILMQEGCQGITKLGWVASALCGTDDLTLKYHGFAVVCPVSCQCTELSCAGYCPHQCCSGTGNGTGS